jgi:hypothetical protein
MRTLPPPILALSALLLAASAVSAAAQACCERPASRAALLTGKPGAPAISAPGASEARPPIAKGKAQWALGFSIPAGLLAAGFFVRQSRTKM